MRRLIATIAVTLLLAVGGCGSGGGNGSDGMGIAGGTQSQSGTVKPTPDESAITSSALRSCLESNGVSLVSSGKTYTDPSGDTTLFTNVEVTSSQYVGEAVWPPEHHAAVYVAPNDTAADDGEHQLEQYVQAFGEDPADFVQRQGNVLVLLDDQNQPTPAEAKVLNDCGAP